MVAEFSVEHTNGLRDLGLRFKEAGDEGKGLKRELLRTIREAGKPAIADVRASALGQLPRRGGLAQRVADSKFATQTRLGAKTAGVRIVGKSKFKIQFMDKGTVRHPVFGNRRAWVLQSVRPNWFDKTIENAADHGMRDAIVAAIEDVSRRVEG